MSAWRNVVLLALLLAAVVVQVAVASQVAILGVVPDLCLMVVLAAGLVRGREAGAVAGFVGGLALDLAPPADHVAGRWALAFAVVGYLGGELVRSDRVRLDPASRVTAGTVAAGASLVATVVFLLAGTVVHDRGAPFGETVGVLAVGVVLDAVVAMLVLPALLRLLARLQPARLQGDAGRGGTARDLVASGR